VSRRLQKKLCSHNQIIGTKLTKLMPQILACAETTTARLVQAEPPTDSVHDKKGVEYLFHLRNGGFYLGKFGFVHPQPIRL
jgi:hypothetical protein